MRQGQQNKQRSRRGNGGGRKNSNSATRSYDSNGPDVKIRGTAAHVAEKYNSLARDALSSGDIVMAENYLQHAEHYNRIVAGIQAQNNEKRAALASQVPNVSNEDDASTATDLSDAPQPGLDSASANNAKNDSDSDVTKVDDDSDEKSTKTVKRRPRRTMRRPRPVDVKSDDGGDAPKPSKKNDSDNVDDQALPAFLLS
jgi:hypothetical protein